MGKSRGRSKYSLIETAVHFFLNDFQVNKYISALVLYVNFGGLGTPAF